MSLFTRIGSDRMKRIDRLNAAGKIVEVHHEDEGTCLVLKSGERMTLEGLSKDDSRRVVGYLGLFGQGENGMDTPAYLIDPNPEAAATPGQTQHNPRAFSSDFSSLTSVLGSSGISRSPLARTSSRPSF